VGAARRLGISAKAREVRGADRVVVRDGEAIGALLTRMGAQDTRLVWEERRMRREGPGNGQPAGEFRRRQSAALGSRSGGGGRPRRAGTGNPR